MIEFVKVTSKDVAIIDALVRNLRMDDEREIFASGNFCVYNRVMFSVLTSRCYAAMVNEQVLCVFGVCTQVFENNYRVVWLLGTDVVDGNKKEFCVKSKAIVDGWVKEYGRLANFVWVKNKKSIRWLKFLGAKFDAPIKAETGEEFVFFTIGGDDNV